LRQIGGTLVIIGALLLFYFSWVRERWLLVVSKARVYRWIKSVLVMVQERISGAFFLAWIAPWMQSVQIKVSNTKKIYIRTRQ
jgi:hypothetical protein